MAEEKKSPEELNEETAPQGESGADTAPEQTEEESGKKAAKGAGKKPKGDAAKLAALEEKLADADKKTEDAKDQLLRVTAEYENFRRRSRTEHDAAFNNGVSHAVENLLPVLDILNAAAYSPTTDEEYKKGVIMTLQKCDEIFKKLGIVEIDAQGQPFDPELHNACMQEECEGVDSGSITKVIQKGYKMNDRVIRHAMVAVAP